MCGRRRVMTIVRTAGRVTCRRTKVKMWRVATAGFVQREQSSRRTMFKVMRAFLLVSIAVKYECVFLNAFETGSYGS